jgi:cystathionine gamma-synthase
VAVRQMRGFGAVVTFQMADDVKRVHRFLSRLKFINIGPSLGGVESLITHPATVSYYKCSRKERYALGITDGLVRLAVGAENAEDIIRDLDQALG